MNVENTLWKHNKWFGFTIKENAKWPVIEYFKFQYSGILLFDDSDIEKVYEQVEFECLKHSK